MQDSRFHSDPDRDCAEDRLLGPRRRLEAVGRVLENPGRGGSLGLMVAVAVERPNPAGDRFGR